jgi:hypothetical protein
MIDAITTDQASDLAGLAKTTLRNYGYNRWFTPPEQTELGFLYYKTERFLEELLLRLHAHKSPAFRRRKLWNIRDKLVTDRWAGLVDIADLREIVDHLDLRWAQLLMDDWSTTAPPRRPPTQRSSDKNLLDGTPPL